MAWRDGIRLLAERADIRKVLTNVTWLSVGHVLKMVIGIAIGIWQANYLGPELFGLLSFAISFVWIFIWSARLGLQEIVVREIVRQPERQNETLGSAFIMQLIGSFIGIGIVVCIALHHYSDEPITKSLLCIVSTFLLFQGIDVFSYAFQSEVAGRHTVIAQIGADTLTAIMRVALIMAGASVILFAYAVAFNGFLTALFLFIAYQATGHHARNWRPRLGKMKSLLEDSWPLIVSGIAILLYMKIDQVMLRELSTDRQVGLYAAAVPLSEAWYFIPAAICGSLFPAIVQLRESNYALYQIRMQQLVDFLTWMSLAGALVVTLVAPWLIATLFSPSYAGTDRILVLHIWSGVLVFQGVAGTHWIIAENQQYYKQYTLIGAAVANVMLNFILIPIAGGRGAAIATLIAYGIATTLGPLCFRSVRHVAIMNLKAFAYPARLLLVKRGA